MAQRFKNFKEMLAHLRHEDVEVKHKAVPVEEVKKKKKTPKKKKKEDK